MVGGACKRSVQKQTVVMKAIWALSFR